MKKEDPKTFSEKELSEKIVTYMKTIPSEEIKKYLNTKELKTQMVLRKHILHLIALCLKAKFGGSGGNPAKDAFLKGQIDELDYNLLSALVDMEAALFNVYQTGWTDIKSHFKELTDSPKSEIDLFLIHLRENEESHLKNCAAGTNQSLKNMEVFFNLIIEKNKMHQKSSHGNFNWTADEIENFNNLQQKNLNGWGDYAYIIALEAAKSDPSIKRATRYFHYCMGEVSRYLLLASSEAKLKGNKWKNGKKYLIGDRGKLKDYFQY